jgi:membrane protein implicated in regulation of membrane protease activity
MSTASLWLIAGVMLCIMESIIPTAFVELTMGISALLMALISPFIPNLGAQVVLWLGLSVVLTLVMRRFAPDKKAHRLDDKEGRTLTEILPGQVGRVLYEGQSWQARCADEHVTIPANQQVYVVERRGTTLIILPNNLLHP